MVPIFLGVQVDIIERPAAVLELLVELREVDFSELTFSQPNSFRNVVLFRFHELMVEQSCKQVGMQLVLVRAILVHVNVDHLVSAVICESSQQSLKPR